MKITLKQSSLMHNFKEKRASSSRTVPYNHTELSNKNIKKNKIFLELFEKEEKFIKKKTK